MTLNEGSVKFGNSINDEDRFIHYFELYDLHTKYFSKSTSK